MKKFSVRTIVAIGIGAALFFVLAKFVAIPSPVPNTSICLQYGVLGFISVLFGPVAGLCSGLIGHVLADFTGYGLWWSWEIASAVFGLIVGMLCAKIALEDGEFGKKEIIRFNVAQVIAHLICWGVVAPVLDIVMYQEPANKVFLQGLVAGVSNIVTTGIVGTLLCLAYVAAKPKKGSLSKEDDEKEEEKAD